GLEGWDAENDQPIHFEGVTSPEVTFTNLDPNTSYDIYLVALCGSNEISSIAGPLTFRTPCVTTQTPFFESFEDGIPSCWTVIDNDGQGRTWTATSEYTHTGNGAVRVQWETNAHGDYLITPHFTVQEGITDQVSFYMGKNSI